MPKLCTYTSLYAVHCHNFEVEKITKYRNYLQFSFLEGKMALSIDGFMVCVYISKDTLTHTKYIFILKQEYIAIPVPVGDN